MAFLVNVDPDILLRWLLRALALISAALLCATALLSWGETPQGFLWQFSLAAENNVAAWWSGSLLAAAALFASDGWGRLRKHDADAGRAWLVIAAILIFLSADEVGSLHERLAMRSEAEGLGSWAFLLPLGALLGVGFLWSVAVLWRVGGCERRRVLWMILGFAVLSSVAVQEYFEHALAWGGARTQALRLTVEEGSELFGILLLLAVTQGNIARPPGRPFVVLAEMSRPLAVAAVLLAPALLALTLWLPDQAFRGRPVDWLAATVFLAAAALAGRRLLSGRVYIGDLGLVVLCGMASAAVVAIKPANTVEVAAFTFGSRAFILSCLVAATAMIWIGRAPRAIVATVAALGIALLFLLLPATRLTAYAFPIALAFCAAAGNRRETMPERSDLTHRQQRRGEV